MPKQKALPSPAPADPDAVILPRNLDAERAVLGSCLLSAKSADYAVERVKADDFFRRSHQHIWTAMAALSARSVAVDMIPLRQELERVKELEDAGGPAYLSSLVDGIPHGINLEHYIGILKDLHAKRALFAFAKRTMDLVGENSHDAPAILADTDQRLMDLQAGHVEGRMLPLSSCTAGLIEDLEWRVGHKGELLGLETGYPSINGQTLGWQAGDLTVIGARPSIGKTTFALNTALAGARWLAAAGRTDAVAIFSFEMRRRQLECRLLSAISGIPLTRLLTGYVRDSEWPILSDAISEMGTLPIEIDDQAGQTRWQIRSGCRRLKASRGLALVIIDYVQLIPGSLERRGASRNEEVTDISRGLKELADDVQVPILLLSQLSRPNRGVIGKPDPRPKLSDLRESGALEQDADNVCFLHRKNHREGGTTEFMLEKQRNGPTGTVNLTLDRDIVTFTDGGEEEAAPVASPLAPGFHRQAPRKEHLKPVPPPLFANS